MKNIIEKYYGLLIGGCGILLAVFFYLGFAQQYHVVMLIGLCATVIALGVCTFVRDNIRKEEKEHYVNGIKEQNKNAITESNEKYIQSIVENTENIKADIISSEQHICDAMQQKVLDIIENSTDIYGKSAETMKEYQEETTKRISDSEKAMEIALSNSETKIERMIESLPKQTQELLDNAITQSKDNIIQSIADNTESIKADIISSEQHICDALQQKVLDIIENSTEIYSKFTEVLKGYQEETTKKISESEKAIENALANSDIKYERMVESLPKQAQSMLDNAIAQKVTPEIQKCNASMESLKLDIGKGRSSVIEILNKNSAELSETQKNIQTQISILHRQNSHLMMLTTMIGTVRSDIAAINEVRAFKNEHKSGRKVRHVRDDEHGIFIENLMNGDGIRIEKSAMFKNDKLVFEADFDESGRMTRSKNYSENSGTFTEITYSNGTVTKSVLGKIVASKK